MKQSLKEWSKEAKALFIVPQSSTPIRARDIAVVGHMINKSPRVVARMTLRTARMM
jgi:hypothetical protein